MEKSTTNIPPISAGNETAKKLNLSKKQLVFLLVPILFLVGVGIFGVVGGFIATDKTNTAQGDSLALDLSPPEAKPKNQHLDQKYDPNFTPADLNPNQQTTDPLATQSTIALTGRNPTNRMASNENLTENDFQAVAQTHSPVSKQAEHQQFVKQNQRTVYQQQQVTKTMYYSPKSSQQLAEERQEQEDRDFNRKATETVLRQIELANQKPVGNSSEPLMMKEYQTMKEAYHGNLPTEYQRLFQKEIEAEKLAKNSSSDGNLQASTSNQISGLDVSSNASGFYGMSHSKTSNSSFSQTIKAMIHGHAHKIIVENGSIVHIRLTEDVTLKSNGQRVFVPAQTLLTGACQISQDRVLISVTEVQIGSAIFPVKLTVYDLDGRAGLSVPDLKSKTMVANQLNQTAQSGMVSPTLFIPQGSIGQQVGTQVAVQAGSSLFSGVRAVVQSKMSQVRVTIKPNYVVILHPSDSKNTDN